MKKIGYVSPRVSGDARLALESAILGASTLSATMDGQEVVEVDEFNGSYWEAEE